MEIKINHAPDSIHEITSCEFNARSINTITVKYKEERQKSKAPTFALT